MRSATAQEGENSDLDPSSAVADTEIHAKLLEKGTKGMTTSPGRDGCSAKGTGDAAQERGAKLQTYSPKTESASVHPAERAGRGKSLVKKAVSGSGMMESGRSEPSVDRSPRAVGVGRPRPSSAAAVSGTSKSPHGGQEERVGHGGASGRRADHQIAMKVCFRVRVRARACISVFSFLFLDVPVMAAHILLIRSTGDVILHHIKVHEMQPSLSYRHI